MTPSQPSVRIVVGVLAASPAEWLSAPGIGPERARALADTLTRRFPPD